MSLITSILTGGINNHETTAEEANALATDFISEGIVGSIANTSGVAPATGGFAVNATGTPDTNVQISAGTLYVTATPSTQGSQTVRVKNSATITQAISANSSGSTKYDWVYLSVDATNANAPNTAGDNVASIVVSRSSSAATDDGTPPTYGVLLAVVTVANGFSTITNSVIRDRRTLCTVGATSDSPETGWVTGGLPAVSSVTENGNRSADITFASTVASILTPGMRIRTSRTVAAPTYMGGAFNGTNHYFTKTTPTSTLSTVTNSFTLMAHIEPTSYATGRIMGRLDGTPGNGFSLYMLSDGRIELGIFNGGSANYRSVATYQSVPLNKKTHVAASWSSGTVAIYFDGISVPVAAATTGGTAPTTAGTGGDFSVGRGGAYNAQYFPGYISGVGAFNAVLSASTIRSYKNQALTGSETNCIGAWSLNNTGVNQQAAGTNDLTAMNSVGYTARSPYCTDANGVASGTYDWAIVTKVSTTTATVQYPEGCAIPTSGGVSAVDYAPSGVPFGFPGDALRWRVETLYRVLYTQSSPATSTWYNMTSTSGVSDGAVHVEPVGQWKRGYEAIIYSLRGVSGTISHHTGLSTANNTAGDTRMIARSYASTILDGMHMHKKESPYNSSTATTLYLNVMTDATSVSSIRLFGNTADTIIYSDLGNL